jgi:hypothetical protein
MMSTFEFETIPFKTIPSDTEMGDQENAFEEEFSRRPRVPAAASEDVRWAEYSLNQVLGLRLPVHGRMDAQARSTLRSFQRRQSVPPSGILGPDTCEALQATVKEPPPGPGDGQQEFAVQPQQQELPVEIRDYFTTHGTKAPAYGVLDETTLDKVRRTSGLLAGNPGLYLITFRRGSKQRAYSGKADDLRKRLLQHRLCLTHLGAPTGGFKVFFKNNEDKAKLRPEERSFHQQLMRVIRASRDKTPMFTNLMTEMEVDG